MPTLKRVESLNSKDRDVHARLILAAYRNTVNDKGETIIEALEAVDEMLERSFANEMNFGRVRKLFACCAIKV